MAQWIQVGPDKGPVACVASIGTTLFAGSGGGVLISNDGGNTWSHPVSLAWNRVITRFAVMGNSIFASGPYPASGFYRSDDKGGSWTDVNPGLPGENILDLAVLNTSVFVGTQGGGIYRSGNLGANWTPVNNGMSADTISSLTAAGQVLFAGTWGKGVFKSVNKGDTWVNLNSGLSKDTVTVLASADNKLYAGIISGKAYRSDDLGYSWIEISAGLSGGITSFAHINNYLFVGTGNGVFRSANYGEYWTALKQGEVQALCTIGGNLFAASWNGIYLSENMGDSWSDKSAGMKNACVRAMSMDGTTLLAGTMNGIFSSGDHGLTWNLYKDCGWVISMAYTPDEFYAGCYNHLSGFSRNSTNWNLTLSIDSANRYYAVAVRNNVVYVGTESRGLFKLVHYGPYLWDPAELIGFPKTQVNGLLLDGTTLYAATAAGVYSTNDDGLHWTALNNGFTDPFTNVLILKGTDLFAGTQGGAFRSVDHGSIWVPVNKGMEDQNVLSFAVNGNNLFAGTWTGGVFLSTDNGANWKPISHESVFDTWFKIPQTIHGLAVDNDYVYAGERNTSVWRRPLSDIITSVQLPHDDHNDGYCLEQNYPNPFSENTTIRFRVPEGGHASLKVFDINGKEVELMFDDDSATEEHEIIFNGRNLPEGIYYYQLQSGLISQTRRMIIMR
jgi:photosystem II stability/assembly factor-like uncharacterized protein